METAKIREDLKDIRYYYSRKAMFEKASASVGIARKSILSSKMFFLNMINVAIAEFTAKTHIIFATNNLTKNLNTFSKIEIV